jgi:phosphoribosylformimino-5-aminoimidazole carboxamide ribotide isomerase
MRIVGVIDIRGGRAVHARGGRRDDYAPVSLAAGERVDGDPAALARVYVEQIGVAELYVADLDAIAGGSRSTRPLSAMAALGVPVWVDAGITTPAAASAVLEAGASVVIVGLETLTSVDALASIVRAVAEVPVAFSVDLRNGVPITMPAAAHAGWSVSQVARGAADAGAGTIIVLDLARVGSGTGVDVELMAEVRRAVPEVTLFAGGGVRSDADLDLLARVGCQGALVATALLSGALRLT